MRAVIGSLGGEFRRYRHLGEGAIRQLMEALHRSLEHTSYHVGQIVYLAKAIRGDAWQYLSIPPGQSEAYNKQPTRERPPAT